MRLFYFSVLIFLSYSFYFTPYDGKDDIEKLRNKNITKEELLQHIKYLSSDNMEGRFPGTKGDLLTDEYITGEFKKYDLKPSSEGYLQEFDLFTQVRMSGKNEFQIDLDGNKTDYIVEKDFIPIGFSGNGKAEGELVFAGYGISAPEVNYDDFKDKDGNEIDVKGKIVVVMKFSPAGYNPHDNPFKKYELSRTKVSRIKQRNAAGIIIINSPGSYEDNLLKLTYDNVAQNAGIPVINSKREIIENILRSKGLDLTEITKKIDSTRITDSFVIKNVKAEIETNVEPVKANTSNVIGMIEGNDPVLQNEFIVIGAHKDHLGYGHYGSLYHGNDKQIHNGADDNASGIAGLLEIAQKISDNKNKLKRSVMFIGFGAEEAGLIGSSYFTKSKLFENTKVVAMLNMDMIGRMVDEKLVIYGTGTSSVWDRTIDSINGSYNFKITKTPDGFGPSDHSSFYTKNIPVLHFFSGTHTDYHSPTDDYEKINSEGGQKIANLVFDVTMVLDNMNTTPDFLKVVSNNEEKRSMGNIKVYVGTIPDYSFSEEGMKLAGVKEGSPAEKGGLKAEDIIVKFGNVDVKNIYDYMYAMGEFKPGEEAEVIVLRNKEKVTLKVVLGSR